MGSTELCNVMPGLVPGIPLADARCRPKRDGRDKPGHDKVLRDNIRRQLILDRADAVAQDELALLQPLHLDDIGAGGGHQGGNRGIEVAVLLLQAHQLLPQLAFFFFGHRHRWFCFAPASRYWQKHGNYRVFHKTLQGLRKIAVDQRLWFRLLRRKAGWTVALAAGLR
jgi:hypothetical protein